MIESTSAAIARAERLARVAFSVADARSAAALPATVPGPHSSLASLITHQSDIASARIGTHEAQGELAKSIREAVGVIDAAIKTGAHLEGIANYIEGTADLPVDLDPQLSVLARSAKSAAQAGIEDAHQIAQDIRRAISSAQAELLRVRAKWANQTESAARIIHAKLAAQFALKCGSPAEIRKTELRLSRVRAAHRHKYAPSTGAQAWRAA